MQNGFTKIQRNFRSSTDYSGKSLERPQKDKHKDG